MSPFNRVLSRVSHRTRFDDVGRDAIVAAIGGLTMVAVVAARMTPPATLIADRYSTLAAILMSATVVTALVAMHDRMERPGRLLAVVLLGATAMAWYSGRLWVHEKQFDYLVDQQKAELEWRTVELYGDLANFLRSRAVAGPPPPRPDSWDRDENAVLTYEQETSLLYEAKYGVPVRRTRERFARRGLTDRDLDAFYRHPSSAFEIGVIARRLAVLARRLEKS